MWLTLFAVMFAWVEAAIVVYLREIYYPEGFQFPLRVIESSLLTIELVREFATLVMLAAVAILAGSSRWQRFAYFALAFGVWDIFFYLWLEVAVGWPASILDWDILFLLPLPWIGPVLAPVIISVILILAGIMILRSESSRPFRPPTSAWVLSALATVTVLWTFMRDTEAGLRSAMPEPYPYSVFFVAVGLYAAALVVSWKLNE